MALPISNTNTHRPDFVLLFSILLLVLMGAVLISSASVVMSKQLTGNPNYFFVNHLWALLGGSVLFFIGYRIDYTFWRKIAPYLIVVALILMALVFVPGIGYSFNGASRWIKWPFFFSPTEGFKLALVIYLAAWFEKKAAHIKRFMYSTLPFLCVLGVAAALILKQPDMGTMMVITATAGTMYLVAGAKWSHIIGILAAGGAGVFMLIKTSAYRMARFMIFLNPTADQSDAGYQINQALLAVGSGGVLGVGFGKSRQKFNYLPEAASDSIFAVTAEELGFLRSSLLVLAFMMFAFQGYKTAEKAPDAFSRLLAVGITTWIVSQALINISAMLSIIPLTGVPLPFISLGSSSTVVLLLASGILLNISRHTQGESRESRSLRRRNWWSYLTGFSRN